MMHVHSLPSLVVTLVIMLLTVSEAYPQGSIRCYHSNARPDRQAICPESRNGFCMKETTNLPQSLCGKTQYFGDRFVNGVCQYKKCLDVCEQGEYQFEFEEQKYNRKRYCCNDVNLCNDGFSLRGGMTWGMIGLLLMSLYLIL
mmetsp:Transcript_18313/g.30543  ORF Transcript_18313/g.30543 Transcript_18313/m.30543 type:complete len:143 (-) Transcript_18313:151-579(-)